MDCYNCGNQLIWGGDHDCEDSEEFLIETNLSCPHCGTHVIVYTPRQGGIE
tara:strand:+ start:732 stop:884 length:153 start_codon:yes stop_codon:yes gene_type:complete